MRQAEAPVRAVMYYALVLAAHLGSSPAVAEDTKPTAAKLPADHAERVTVGLEIFKTDVRAVLVEKCVHCHAGADVEAEFDLSTRESLLRGGTSGPAIELWNGKASLLYRLITHEEEPTMPQEASKLSDKEITAIASWIDNGAPYDKPLVDPEAEETPWTERVVPAEAKDYWAFRPLAAVEPPQVQKNSWVRNPIDQFILARLQPKGIAPNHAAERRVLIRRAYLDLIGMPPSPEEVTAFVADTDPQAYEKLIDRLLDSKHYGERWARHWLDVARFGESEGGEHDYDRKNAYHYRDFVIRALNSDMPFDQFARWQIAGDELAPDDPLALAATGFLVAGTFPTQLTETEFEPARYDQLDDMASTTSAAFLGLSVGCARCHDHKFDPIPARDYYQFLSTFSGTIRSEIDIDSSTPAQRKEGEQKYQQELERLQLALKRFDSESLPEKFNNFVAEYSASKQPEEDWLVLDVVSHETEGAKLQRQGDGSLLAVGATPAVDTYKLTALSPTGRLTGIRIEALTHASLPRKGPGLAHNGNFCLSDLQVTVQTGDAEPRNVKLIDPRFTHQQNGGALSIAASLDGDKNRSGWAVDAGGIGKDQAVSLAFAEPIEAGDSTALQVMLRFHHPNTKHTMGRVRLSVTRSDPQTVALRSGENQEPAIPAAVLATLESLKQGATVDQAARHQAEQWYAARLPKRAELLAAIQKHEKAGPAKHIVKMQVGGEGFPKLKHHANGRGYPHFYAETHFLKRGDTKEKQGVAKPAFLQVLLRDPEQVDRWRVEPTADAKKSFQRAALARWLTDVPYGAGSLTARVAVNRLWLHHFGRGIVPTPNDFGKSGEDPTHPELLEWLANRLVEGGWRLKPLHKMMMLSAAYMQNSDHDEARAAIDPENTLYWRRDVNRLEAEAIRDSMLAVSGLLDERMFGPGERSEASRRRSVYFFVKRSNIPAVLQLFDLPEPLVSQGMRPATTIAPQSLMFMNNPQVQAYAKAFAQRLGATADDPNALLVQRAFQLALGREPTPGETEKNVKFIEAQQENYASLGEAGAKQAALADMCQVMFCLNEFIYVP